MQGVDWHQENHDRLVREREALGRDFDDFRTEAARKLRTREEDFPPGGGGGQCSNLRTWVAAVQELKLRYCSKEAP